MNLPLSCRPLLRAVPLVVAGCLVTGGASAHAISGAIFTTEADGSPVNANIYDHKDDVYLNGGPNKGPCTASRLDDDDDYYFQVTDPSGQVLLSLDAITARRFGVSADGVINGLGDTRIPPETQGTHLTGTDAIDCGNTTVQLMPYANTPNPGGVYKVWITRVGDYVPGCETTVGGACGNFGFVAAHSKTDNYKVRACPATDPNCDEEIEEFGQIKAIKFYDANANGEEDAGEPRLEGWPMTLINTQLTGADGTTTFTDLIPDIDYMVTEGTPVQGNWVHSSTSINGVYVVPPENPAGPLEVVANETTVVRFGNYCTVPSNGNTLGFWSNKNGQKLVSAGGDLGMLAGLHLRNKNGSDFDPASASALSTWLLNGDAVNMAYMLSVQLAAMELNVYNGFVNGGAYYVPAGMTINDLMAAANTSLGLYPVTISGNDPFDQRSNQEQLKNWLDELNNNAGVLSPTPCAYSFN